MLKIKVLCWNIRGASGFSLRSMMFEIISEHQSDMVILLETSSKVVAASRFVNFMQGTHISHTLVLGNGYSGGIWSFWDPKRPQVHVNN